LCDKGKKKKAGNKKKRGEETLGGKIRFSAGGWGGLIEERRLGIREGGRTFIGGKVTPGGTPRVLVKPRGGGMSFLAIAGTT